MTEADSALPARGPHDPGTRVGRWHTARGPMTLSGWLHYPAAWWRARQSQIPERPWIVPAAVGWLRRRIRSDWSVLELGAGRSTPWLAQRADSVLSLEDDEFWYRHALERLEGSGLANVDLRLRPVQEFGNEVSSLPPQSFDLLVLDFLESPQVTRIDCVRPAKDSVRPGGHLLLDDSDRPGYAEAFELLAGWRCRRFVGVKDGWPEVCETAVFTRPRT